MSIIHEALKRKERLEAGDAPVPVRGSAGTRRSVAAFWQSSWFPGVLAASGVLLAATLTYLITRPGEITVVLPPPAQPTAAPSTAAPGAAVGSPELPPSLMPSDVPPGYTFQPAFPSGPVPLGGAADPVGNAYTGNHSPAGARGSTAGAMPSPDEPGTGGPRSEYRAEDVSPHPATGIPAMTASSSEYPHIPVYGAIPGVTPGLPASAASPSAANAGFVALQPAAADFSASELPPDAVTIEMSQGRLESFSGAVSVNSTVPRPGAPVRVGTVVSTQPGAAATLAFENAHVDIAGASTARISRLERRSDPSGSAREELTVHLATGSARTVVRPGGGQVLISTDQVTAAASSGAFQVQARADGSVTVQSEGGQVRLIPRNGAPMTLGVGQQATWRNGAWE